MKAIQLALVISSIAFQVQAQQLLSEAQTISASFEGPSVEGSTVIISPSTLIRFSQQGTGDEAPPVEYRVDLGKSLNYKHPITVTAPGLHSITYRKADEGLQEQHERLEFIVDSEGPSITARVVYKSITLKEYIFPASSRAKKTTVLEVPMGAELHFFAKDNMAGLASLSVGSDKSLRNLENPVELVARGTHTYFFIAKDLVGNETKSDAILLEIVNQ